MKRDADVQRIFEIADDSLQGIIGFHMYVSATQNVVEEEKIFEHLPDRSFQITNEWVRYYQKEDLVRIFRTPVFEFFECRVLLIAMTNIFEATLSDLIDLLHEKGYSQYTSKRERKNMGYKQYIQWMSGLLKQVRRSDYGNEVALERVPETLGIIDNARRLRNLVVHNQALFDEFYEKNAVQSDNMVVDLHPHWREFRANPLSQIPIIIDWRYLYRFLIHHIEILHILHNCIQRVFFKVTEGYNYTKERKPIDWERMLWTKVKVRIG